MPPDETLKEVVLSLDASSMERIATEEWAIAGLDALAGFDACLQRRYDKGALTLVCAGRSLTANWPPRKPLDVALLLSDAARLVDPEQQVRAVRVERMARALAMAVDDPYTAYLPPSMVAIQQETLGHALATATPGLDLWPRDPTRVRNVLPGSDAAKHGLVPGDRVLAIDGAEVAVMTLPEILQKLQGSNQSTVKLIVNSVERGGSAGNREVIVKRTLVAERDVMRRQLGSVLYLHIPIFKAGVAETVQKALQASSSTKLILDLRHNPGGLLPEAIALLDVFLRDGRIAGVQAGPGRRSEEFLAQRDPFDIAHPVVVLVDSGSASASELCAVVLQERHRATVLGATTAGKGSVQQQIRLPDGGMLRVTVGAYTGPSGRRLDEGGVRPDRFLAPPTSRTVLDGANPLADSWVLSALDTLRQPERPTGAATTVDVARQGPER